MHPNSRSRGTTAQQILDVAESLAQTRGYNGFSYADISLALGITKASLHYHFPTKEALGRSLMERYSARFEIALAEIGETPCPAREMVERYARLYRDVLVLDRLCLCGMLAAEVSTLSANIQAEIRRFFDLNERWLVVTFARARAEGSLAANQDPGEAARLFMGALEGAMLVARSYGQPERFDAAAEQLIALFFVGAD